MNDDALGRWPVTLDIRVAWGEMDAFGHVNNTVYLRWFESARIAYFERVGLLERWRATGVGPIVARIAIDYRAPVTFPDVVRVAATVTRFGTTSFTMAYSLVSEARDGAVVAEGESIVVMLDYRAGAKITIDDELRGAVRALEREGSLGAS